MALLEQWRSKRSWFFDGLAVIAGGGVNHRRDLEDQLLLKENHFAKLIILISRFGVFLVTGRVWGGDNVLYHFKKIINWDYIIRSNNTNHNAFPIVKSHINNCLYNMFN